MSTLNVTNLKNEASASNNVTLDSNGRVGVGIAPNTSLHVKGNITVENTTNFPFISFVESGDNTDEKARIEMDQLSGTAGQLIFYTENGGTLGERLRIQSAGGISFNGDTAAANALDDYEEGTWTPIFVNAGTGTYSQQLGRYTRVGNIVTVHCQVRLSSLGTASGHVKVGGLPFVVLSVSGLYGATSAIHFSVTATNITNGNGLGNPGLTVIDFYDGNSTAITATQHSQLGTGTVIFSMTYLSQ